MAFEDRGNYDSAMSGQTPAVSVRDLRGESVNVQPLQQAADTIGLPAAQGRVSRLSKEEFPQSSVAGTGLARGLASKNLSRGLIRTTRECV